MVFKINLQAPHSLHERGGGEGVPIEGFGLGEDLRLKFFSLVDLFLI